MTQGAASVSVDTRVCELLWGPWDMPTGQPEPGNRMTGWGGAGRDRQMSRFSRCAWRASSSLTGRLEAERDPAPDFNAVCLEGGTGPGPGMHRAVSVAPTKPAPRGPLRGRADHRSGGARLRQRAYAPLPQRVCPIC